MRYLLFTTTTCPKCPAMKEEISKYITFDGEMMDDLNPDFFARAQEFGLSSVPMLIVFDDDNNEVARSQDPSEVSDLVAKLS